MRNDQLLTSNYYLSIIQTWLQFPKGTIRQTAGLCVSVCVQPVGQDPPEGPEINLRSHGMIDVRQ